MPSTCSSGSALLSPQPPTFMYTAVTTVYVHPSNNASITFVIAAVIQHRACVVQPGANEKQAYTTTNHITNGSPNTEKRCREAQASTAFLWFGWAAWVATLAFSIMNGGSSGANLRGGIRRGPAMSQV